MSTLDETARAEADKRWPGRWPGASGIRDAFVAGARWVTRTHPGAPETVAAVAELDALPVGSVVLNGHGVAFVKVRTDVPDFQWTASGHAGYWTASAILGEPAVPARVLSTGACCGDGTDGYCAACPERPRATPTRDDVAAAIFLRYPSFDPITARALADVVAPLYEGTRP